MQPHVTAFFGENSHILSRMFRNTGGRKTGIINWVLELAPASERRATLSADRSADSDTVDSAVQSLPLNNL